MILQTGSRTIINVAEKKNKMYNEGTRDARNKDRIKPWKYVILKLFVLKYFCVASKTRFSEHIFNIDYVLFQKQQYQDKIIFTQSCKR